MHAKQIPGETLAHEPLTNSAPAANVGVELNLVPGATKPSLWIVTVTIAGAISDLFLWGLLAGGAANDVADDVWGLVEDVRDRAPLGKLGTALPVGSYHFIVADLGVFLRVYLQKTGAGTATATVTPIYFANRGS
jgi:hypothetical protein